MERDSIMVVEDEAIVAMDLSNTLSSLGYEVLSWQKSGEEALQFLEERQPDLILMDIKLKGKMDGIQAAEVIRKGYDLPVIFLTAFSDKETLDRAKLSLPYGYITKSYNINDLRSTMEMALYKHRMERKLREQQRLQDVSLNSIYASVINTDKDGCIRFLNRSARELFGLEKGEKIGEPVDTLGLKMVSGDGLGGNLREMTLESSQGCNRARFCTVSGKDHEIPVECVLQAYYNDQGAVLGYVYILRDLSEERQYYEVQARLASIVEYSDDAIISLSMDGTIRSWNQAAERMFGYSVEESIGKNIIVLTPSFLPDTFSELLERMTSGAHQNSFETIRARKDGSIIHVSLMLSPICDNNGNLSLVSVIARDISEKRRLEAAVLEMSEKERIRIGQDLHDSLGQHLTGILLNMKLLEKELEKNGSSNPYEQAVNITGMMREAVQKTRDLAKNLAPPIIETEGIREALKSLVSTVEELYRTDIVLITDSDHPEPDTTMAIQLYRIAQEAVNNALKHSGGTKITVSLNGGDNELVLVVADNGMGIEDKRSDGMGIGIMHYRADMVHGDLSVSGRPGEGTRVQCRIPLQKESP